jgi:hypothetical protein
MNFITVKLMGGLGNYLFQLSSAYSVSLRENKELICDVNDINIGHSNYHIYKSNIFRNVRFDTVTSHEVYYEPKFEYSEIPKINNNVKLVGYFQSEKYFKQYEQEIRNFFSIDDETLIKIKNKYSNIIDSNTCSIHVRRGDYLRFSDIHTVLNIEYYKKSISVIGEDKLYLIFSDDIEWCQENFEFIKNKIFITDNEDYVDLYLMSMCKNNIIANSSFSWWGAWLNQNKNKIVISPSNWFGVGSQNLTDTDIHCNNWIIL